MTSFVMPHALPRIARDDRGRAHHVGRMPPLGFPAPGTDRRRPAPPNATLFRKHP